MNWEKDRINALYNLSVLDSEQEAEFDNIVQLASQICQTPVSLISLVDYERQWFKANKGFDKAEISRSGSFCAHAILQQGVMTVKDATLDNRFADNPLVTGAPFIRFYAGTPLVTQTGHALGTLCVIDQQSRELSQEQLFGLRVLGQQIVTQLEMRAKIKRLNMLTESKDKILAVISHDVKGPLNNIRQLFSLFEQGKSSAKDIKRLSGKIIKTLDKTDQLLSDLISWFLSQVEGEGLNLQDLDLSELVREVFTEVSQRAQQKKNTLNFNFDSEIIFYGDRNMLKFIFRNILVNAIKYTEKGSISVNIKQTAQAIVVVVKDSGIGIEKSRLEKLFTNESVKWTKGTANEQGHGLGLLLAQDFAQKHHGHIEIFSEPGSGTEVHIVLPIYTNTFSSK
jgi:signal transduction histidine kinase